MPEIDERHYLSIRKHSKSEPAYLSLNRYMSGTEVEWGFLVAGICERGRWASRAENRPLAVLARELRAGRDLRAKRRAPPKKTASSVSLGQGFCYRSLE